MSPLIIAANRDEFHARPTRAPQPLEGTRAVAGIDEVSGGTWMGVTATGFFVGITNQRQGRRPEAQRNSRGPLVKEALALASTSGIEAMLEELEPGTTNPFNLMYGGAGDLRCAYVRDSGHRVERVGEGVSVLPNDVMGSADFPKAERAKALAVAASGALSWNDLDEALRAALASHVRTPPEAFASASSDAMPSELLSALDALCVHLPHYGTRSFSLAGLRPGQVVRYLYADGPPCTTAPIDLTSVVTAL